MPAQRRVVSVDPKAYDVVSNGLIDFLIEALTVTTDGKLAFSDPDAQLKAYLSADDKHLTKINVAQLLAAASFKIHEKVRVGMAEADLGAGQFDADVKAVKVASEKYALPQQISTEERTLLDTSKAKYSDNGKFSKFPTGTKLFDMNVKTTKGELQGRLVYTVRAPATRVLAYYMGWVQLYHAKATEGATPIETIERENDHSVVSRSIVKMPYPLQTRETVTKTLWEKVGEGEYFYSLTTTTHPACPASTDKLRMTFTRLLKLKQTSPSVTSVTFVGSVHLGGVVPKSMNSIVTISIALAQPPNAMLYFAAVRAEDEFDDGDSNELGQLAILKLYRHRAHPDVLRKEINEIISMVNVLRAFQAKYRFLDEFLYHIIMNSIKRGAAQTRFSVNTSLSALTANEAGHVARSLSMLLMSNASGDAAIDEFFLTFPSLRELDEEFTWFKPTMVAIATELMNKVAYGVKIRAAVGGSVSMLDLATDVVVISEYIVTNRGKLAYLLIGMIAVNILFQCILVWMQTQGLTENKRRTMMAEMLTTVFFLKPALDAWKVASGADQLPGAVLPPMTEMTISKGCEMVFEAVPGMVLQFAAILQAKKRTPRAVASLLISAASTGLTATTLFYDMDVDPGVRKRNPVWCGTIPNQGRGRAFAITFVFCTLHVLAKGAATALFFIADPRFLMIYMAADYGLYLMYCAARKDIIFFIPTPATVSWVISPIVRMMMKVLCDFSGTPHVRLPLLLGGSYYVFNLISAQASVFIAVHLYNLEMAKDDENATEKIAADSLWRMAAVLVGSWCAAITFFFTRVVTPTHRHTFWSTVSGRQCVQEYFTKGTTDEDKLVIFGSSTLLWESDIGSEVMEFTLQNWAKWEREKPAWFTLKVKASVPDNYIPRAFVAALGGANRMRRGSAAGSVRESFRAIEDVGRVEGEATEENVDENIEEITKVEVIKGFGVINGAEHVEEGKNVMVEEDASNIMSDID
jgi:hypothetical protein